MPGIEQQDHNPWIEQQLQTNRRVKEHRHCTQQRIAERHANKSSQQPATDCGQRDEVYGLASTPALCEYLIRPHFWRSSGWTGRTVMLVLVIIGVWHTLSKIWTAIKLHTDATNDQVLAKRWSRCQAILLVTLAAIGCGLLGTFIGMSFSDSLLSAMPMFFDPSIRLELLLYPWIMVLLLDAGHSLSQRIDI